MYEFKNGTLSIPARLLYDEWQVMSYKNYNVACYRKKIIRTQEGRGQGNEAWVSVFDLPRWLQTVCAKKLGDPAKQEQNRLLDFLQADIAAAAFFVRHRKPDGKPMSDTKQNEKVNNCRLLNAMVALFEHNGGGRTMFSHRSAKAWQQCADWLNLVDVGELPHSLPGNWRRLRQKCKDYTELGRSVFIHGGEGNENRNLLKGEPGDYCLAKYCLPVKYAVPEVLAFYNQVREEREWPEITERTLRAWLEEPERDRIIRLARHGKEVWAKKYKHTVTRGRDEWFPNCYWAIDGSKLDWVHLWEGSANKMGAKLRIDLVFDVFTEKILGYSYSFSETITDHFAAIKMAMKEALCRPYLVSYDQQSGHKSSKMQAIYNQVVARDKGTHYCHRSKDHSSPAEQLFKRFQDQVLNNFWFSDGQSVTVRLDDNKMNPDFIEEHKHLLKTTAELEKAFAWAVKKWNNMQHPSLGMSREEAYNSLEMPMVEALSLDDIMRTMWIEERKRPIEYRGHGLDIWASGKKYQYEVYDSAGNIDLDFRRKYVGKKFMVRYDPEFMDTYVQLGIMDEKAEWLQIALAEPKRKHQVIPALMKAGDKEQWYKDYKVRDLELERDMKAVQELQKRTGISPKHEIDAQELEVKLQGRRSKPERLVLEAEASAINKL